MLSSRQIIEEISQDAAALQRKILTLPGPGETLSQEQHNKIDGAQNGLQGWRGWELGELKQAFAEK